MSAYTIRPAQPEHVPALPGIERAAVRLFPPGLLPPHLQDRVVPLDVLSTAQAEGRLWVALAPEGRPVGFALAHVAGSAALLAEMDVHPEHGRKGLGSALVGAVVDWARSKGFAAVTLTTFEHLPWNAPFYERLGFYRLSAPELPPGLAHVLLEEAREGLRGRVAMRLDLGPRGDSESSAGLLARARSESGGE
jgi:GNAT superfamily N-acetyltransferase